MMDYAAAACRVGSEAEEGTAPMVALARAHLDAKRLSPRARAWTRNAR
jgi:hypothetical protein